jgi:thymidylate synthase
MALNCQLVEAISIDDAHFQLIRRLFQVGRVYVIDRGSYEGHKRLEYDHVTFHIREPGTRPLAPQLPAGVPAVTDDKTIEEYCAKYLMDGCVAENEIYTYGQYIQPQLEPVIAMLRDQGAGTNQATIAIGEPKSITQEHPPCLRLIDCRVMYGALHFIVYFRSWDLWAGLPENLGGLQLLKEYMASQIGVNDGEMVASSKGLHLYDYQWPVALARLAGNMPENSVISREEAEMGEGWKV